MNILIFNKDSSFLMAVSSLPSQDYLNTDLYTIATIPEGKVFDSRYSYSPVDGIAVKGDLIPIDTVEVQRLQAEYDSKQYQRDRATTYPSLQDQADMQYWDAVNGTTTWQDAIAKVKADYPKG